MLLRLAYLGMTNAFAVLRLLPMTGWPGQGRLGGILHEYQRAA
ncbi:hypothetical protein ACWDKQ_30845 [Saccharopolyspora sp. NPDC000995]